MSCGLVQLLSTRNQFVSDICVADSESNFEPFDEQLPNLQQLCAWYL